MAIKRIIIHPGMHKTASTSIQETLYLNRLELEQCGFFYPTNWGVNHSQLLVNLFSTKPRMDHEFNFKYGRTTEEQVVQYTQKNEAIFLEEVRRTNCEQVILSGEAMFDLNTEDIWHMRDFLQKHFPDAAVEIIIYVRNTVENLNSLYQQRFSSDLWANLEDARKRACINYRQAIEKYLTMLGDKVFIYRFEDAVQHPCGPTGHFLQAIGFPSDHIPALQIRRSNESRCQEVIDFVSALNQTKPLIVNGDVAGDWGHGREVFDTLPLRDIKGAKFQLPYEEKKELYALAQDDIAWLKEATGIDYTGLKIERQEPQELYQPQTIEGFIQVFDKLTGTLQAHFLDFFAEKYKETEEEKFKALFAEGSIPWKAYHLASVGDYAGTKDSSLNKRVMFDGSRIMWRDNLQVFVRPNQRSWAGKEQFLGRWYPDSEDRLRVSLRFGAEQDIRGIRIDPSLYSSLVCVGTLLVNGMAYDLDLLRGNYDDRAGDTFVFYLDDPQLYIDSVEPITSLESEFIVDTGSFTYARYATLKIAELMEEHREK